MQKKIEDTPSFWLDEKKPVASSSVKPQSAPMSKKDADCIKDMVAQYGDIEIITQEEMIEIWEPKKKKIEAKRIAEFEPETQVLTEQEKRAKIVRAEFEEVFAKYIKKPGEET